MNEIKSLDPAINDKVSRDFSDGLPRLIRAGPGKMLIPGAFKDFASEYRDFELRKDDVIITGYPRSGTTLTQEIVWLLVNNLDFEKAKNLHYNVRIPFFEGKSVLPEKNRDLMNTEIAKTFVGAVELLQDIKEGPRVFKTHLHLQLLPPDLFEKGCKIIYLARHPKDVVVSFYHLQKSIAGREFNKDFKTFFNYFINDLIMFTPYWTHIEQGWEKRNAKNFKFFFYEDLTRDLRGSVEEISKFLGRDYSSKQLDAVSENLQFDNFKTYINAMNTKGNFVRKGQVGGWKDFFDDEMNSEADRWISENVQRIGITHPFELD